MKDSLNLNKIIQDEQRFNNDSASEIWSEIEVKVIP